MYVLPCVILILCFSVFLLFREGICDLTDCLFEGIKIRKLDDSLWQFIPQDGVIIKAGSKGRESGPKVGK